MGAFVRQFDVTVQHDGEPITVTLKPAKYGDVSPLQSAATQDAVIKGFQSVLGEYITEMKGPFDAAGVQVSKDDFLSLAYFVKPVLEIGTEWVKRAAPQNPPSPGA